MTFPIPPGTRDYVSRADFRFSRPSMLLSLMPHMHLRGKSMRFVAEYPDGRREVILDVPRYEFDWQNLYVLDPPRPMPEGTMLQVRVASAPETVPWVTVEVRNSAPAEGHWELGCQFTEPPAWNVLLLFG